MAEAVKSTVDDGADDYLQLELDRLDALQMGTWDAAMAGDIASANVLLRIIEQRVGLLGLERSKPEARPPRTVVNVEARALTQPGLKNHPKRRERPRRDDHQPTRKMRASFRGARCSDRRPSSSRLRRRIRTLCHLRSSC
jgi:hypothetical protein